MATKDDETAASMSMPTNAKACLVAANEERQAGNFRGSVKLIEAAMELQPVLKTSPVLYMQLGSAQFGANQFDGALESFSFALQRDGANARAAYNKAMVLSRLGRHDEALQAYDASLTLVENGEVDVASLRDTCIAGKTRSLNALGRFEESMALLGPNAASGPVKMREALVASLAMMGKREEAASIVHDTMEDAVISSQLSEPSKRVFAFVLSREAKCFMRSARYADALASLVVATRLDPTYHNLYNVGMCEMKLGRRDEAQSAFRAATASDPTQWKAADQEAKLCARSGDFEDAVRLYEEIISKAWTENADGPTKTHMKVSYAYADALWNLKRFEEAKEQAIIAVSYADSKAGADTASRRMSQTSQRSGSTGSRQKQTKARKLLGTILADAGDLDGAFRVLEVIQGGDPDVEHQAGCLLALQGKESDAKDAFEKAIKLNPNHRRAQSSKDLLAELRNHTLGDGIGPVDSTSSPHLETLAEVAEDDGGDGEVRCEGEGDAAAPAKPTEEQQSAYSHMFDGDVPALSKEVGFLISQVFGPPLGSDDNALLVKRMFANSGYERMPEVRTLDNMSMLEMKGMKRGWARRFLIALAAKPSERMLRRRSSSLVRPGEKQRNIAAWLGASELSKWDVEAVDREVCAMTEVPREAVLTKNDSPSFDRAVPAMSAKLGKVINRLFGPPRGSLSNALQMKKDLIKEGIERLDDIRGLSRQEMKAMVPALKDGWCKRIAMYFAVNKAALDDPGQLAPKDFHEVNNDGDEEIVMIASASAATRKPRWMAPNRNRRAAPKNFLSSILNFSVSTLKKNSSSEDTAGPTHPRQSSASTREGAPSLSGAELKAAIGKVDRSGLMAAFRDAIKLRNTSFANAEEGPSGFGSDSDSSVDGYDSNDDDLWN